MTRHWLCLLAVGCLCWGAHAAPGDPYFDPGANTIEVAPGEMADVQCIYTPAFESTIKAMGRFRLRSLMKPNGPDAAEVVQTWIENLEREEVSLSDEQLAAQLRGLLDAIARHEESANGTLSFYGMVLNRMMQPEATPGSINEAMDNLLGMEFAFPLFQVDETTTETNLRLANVERLRRSKLGRLSWTQLYKWTNYPARYHSRDATAFVDDALQHGVYPRESKHCFIEGSDEPMETMTGADSCCCRTPGHAPYINKCMSWLGLTCSGSPYCTIMSQTCPVHVH